MEMLGNMPSSVTRKESLRLKKQEEPTALQGFLFSFLQLQKSKGHSLLLSMLR